MVKKRLSTRSTQLEDVALHLDKELGLDTLGVEYHIDDSIRPLVNKHVLKAGKLVVEEIRKEISGGLPVSDITLTRLDDYDAGQWSMVVFLIKVALDTQAANDAWDRILYRISELEESYKDQSVRKVLNEEISIQFTWH